MWREPLQRSALLLFRIEFSLQTRDVCRVHDNGLLEVGNSGRVLLKQATMWHNE